LTQVSPPAASPRPPRRGGARSLPWLLLGAGVVTLVALALFGSQQPVPSTHSSTSDAADGTSALARAAASGGHPIQRLQASPDADAGLLFIFSPNLPYDLLDAASVARFVKGGGIVVYANETSDPEFEGEFGLVRQPSAVRDLVAYPPGPLLHGVNEVSGGADAQPFDVVRPDQVPLLRGPGHEVLALEEHRGKGVLIAIADPLILCNGYILRSDNARFVADILGLAPAGQPVAFDESHHVAASAAPAPQAAGGVAPWVAAIIWAVAIFYLGLALRGRAFGPPVPLAPARARSSAEYVDAVSTLLRRSGGRRQALDILLQATRISLARRVGGRQLPPDRLRDALGRRWPDLAARLAEAEQAASSGDSEDDVLDAARKLHELAVPEGRL